ncbi:hypothetical protein SK128_005175 [Halocaridina rubra]|uniref:Ig-like domain-containing protein n=1 Tax=Halocaridina rubra TaxID=373956 RepID=A0AAN8WZ42_HALRR
MMFREFPTLDLAWIQRDRSAILTVGNHVITRNNRIGVSHDGHRTWYLNIRDVRPGDAGTYMCQINTEIAISQIGHVGVVGKCLHFLSKEIATIHQRRDEFERREVTRGSQCDPGVQCQRVTSANYKMEERGPGRHQIKSHHFISRGSRSTATPASGEQDRHGSLPLHRIQWHPAIGQQKDPSRIIPTVYAPHQLVGVPIGQDVTLECYIEAWPPGLNYWKRPNGIQVLHTDNK